MDTCTFRSRKIGTIVTLSVQFSMMLLKICFGTIDVIPDAVMINFCCNEIQSLYFYVLVSLMGCNLHENGVVLVSTIIIKYRIQNIIKNYSQTLRAKCARKDMLLNMFEIT